MKVINDIEMCKNFNFISNGKLFFRLIDFELMMALLVQKCEIALFYNKSLELKISINLRLNLRLTFFSIKSFWL